MKIKWLLALFLFSSFARALPVLSVHAKTIPSAEPLTTDKVWALDPGEQNPARAVYALHREVTLEGFHTEARAGGYFGVTADAISSVTTIFVRPTGSSFYRPPGEFPCAKDLPSWFNTPSGAAQGAAAAAAAWDTAIQGESIKLGALLRHLEQPNEEQAKLAAQLLFDAWLKDTTALWRPKADRAARQIALTVERREAIEAGACSRRAGTQATAIGWATVMEPVPAEPEKPYPLPIARAPAKRWDGAFSIRVLLDAAGAKKLDGMFLLDSATPQTIVSPDWLRSQGILPPVIEVTGAALERALFTGGEAMTSGDLAPRGRVTSLSIGGLVLPIRDILMHDTELYAPPENANVCCSGILGLDFLQHYVLQFRPGLPLEVVVWPRENFHPIWTELKNPVWVEASVTPNGGIVSACDVRSSDGRAAYHGVLWDTAASIALEAHTPWKAAAGKSWNLVCDHLPNNLASSVFAETHMESSPFAREKEPAMTIGAPILARGPFILDLPHGRIWFSGDDLKAPLFRNRTGLSLTYDFLNDDRVLKVLSVHGGHGSPAASLAASGLRAGAIITAVDDQPAGELDLWDVEQRLGGAHGSQVKLSWISVHDYMHGETGDPVQGVITVTK